MSSNVYAAGLPTSNTLRRIVIATGIAAALAGTFCIVTLPFAPAYVAVLALAWGLIAVREISRLRRAYATFCRIRIVEGGAVTLRGIARTPVAARLLPGSVVLRRVGWLRLEAANGLRYGELIAGNSRKNKDWRRFQVIWRHL